MHRFSSANSANREAHLVHGISSSAIGFPSPIWYVKNKRAKGKLPTSFPFETAFAQAFAIGKAIEMAIGNVQ